MRPRGAVKEFGLVFGRVERKDELHAPEPAQARPPVTPELAAPLGGVLALQRSVGNALVSRAVAELRELGPRKSAAAMLPDVDAEAAGSDTFVGVPISAEGHGEPVQLVPAELNEFGEMDGDLKSPQRACVFVDGGRVGEAAIYWSGGGGNGGRGQQGLGDITLVAPAYDGADPAKAGDQATAWVNVGTGTATVTRSFMGVPNGANGTWWFTAAARTRVDTHEKLHIAATKKAHDTHIVPLEKRIADATGSAKAFKSGATKADAITALKTQIDWNTSITAFQTEDRTQNTPGPPLGPVDAADKSSGTYVTDYGPRAVAGVNYAHYADVPPGPGPAPAPTPAPAPAPGP